MKDSMIQAATSLCPEKAAIFKNINLSTNTVGEHIAELSDDIYNQLRSKFQELCVCSFGLDESTDLTCSAQLAVFLGGVNHQFEVTEELLNVTATNRETIAKEIFQR